MNASHVKKLSSDVGPEGLHGLQSVQRKDHRAAGVGRTGNEHIIRLGCGGGQLLVLLPRLSLEQSSVLNMLADLYHETLQSAWRSVARHLEMAVLDYDSSKLYWTRDLCTLSFS